MSLSTYMRDFYRAVYSSVKSEESVGRIRASGLTDEEKERVVSVLKRLAHPAVASVWDAYELAMMCTSGLIPGVSRETVDDARRIIAEVKKNYPYVEQKQGFLTPPEMPESPSVADIALGVSWSNRVLSRIVVTLQAIQEASSSTLKAQCPFCLEDMTLLVREREIVLKCAKGSTPACKRSEWRFSSVGGRVQES